MSLCYKDATSQPFSYFMIDLSPKTFYVLSYSSDLERTSAVFSVRRHAISLKLVTFKQHFSVPRHLKRLSLFSDRLALPKECGNSFVDFLSEAIVRILQGVVVGKKKTWKNTSHEVTESFHQEAASKNSGPFSLPINALRCWMLILIILLDTFCNTNTLTSTILQLELMKFVSIPFSQFNRQLLSSSKPNIAYCWIRS